MLFTVLKKKIQPVILQKNVICIGNSLTLGAAGNLTGKSYPTLLSETQKAISKNWEIHNKGVNGAGTQELLGRFDWEVKPLIDLSKNNIAIFWEGTNDLYYGRTPQQALDNYKTYTDLLKTNGVQKIVWLNTIPRGDFMQSGGTIEEYNSRLDQLNVLIYNNRSYVDYFIDVRSTNQLVDYNDTQYFSTDKIHLVTGGYQVIVNLLLPIL